MARRARTGAAPGRPSYGCAEREGRDGPALGAIQLLSDEVWRQLDPSAGKLSRRDVRRAATAAVAVVLLLVASYAVVGSGLLVPRVAHDGAGGYGHQAGTMYYEFRLANQGWFPVQIVGVGRDGPGLEQVAYPARIGGHPTGAVPGGRLGPGEALDLGVAYRVTDCGAVPDEPWPVPVRVARPWGIQTVWIELPAQSRRDLRLPPDQRQGDTVWWDDQVEWQRNLADAVCYYAAGGQPWDSDRLED